MPAAASGSLENVAVDTYYPALLIFSQNSRAGSNQFHGRDRVFIVQFGRPKDLSRCSGFRPPLMLVPGTLQSADRWIDTGYVEALASDYRLLLFDPLGHGRSEQSTDPSDYAPEKLVKHIEDTLDHVGVAQAHMWGYSRGALMASCFAAEHPERALSLVYRGNVLFDIVALQEALGLTPDPETREKSERSASSGDWGAYWDLFPVPLPETTKAFLQQGNDPSVQVAVMQGRRLGPMTWEAPTVPAIVYWGEGEIFHSLNLKELAPPLESFNVSGGHAEAFSSCDPALADVTPFLSRH